MLLGDDPVRVLIPLVALVPFPVSLDAAVLRAGDGGQALAVATVAGPGRLDGDAGRVQREIDRGPVEIVDVEAAGAVGRLDVGVVDVQGAGGPLLAADPAARPGGVAGEIGEAIIDRLVGVR